MSIEFIEDPNNRIVYARIDNLENITRQAIRQGFFKLGNDLKKTANANILSRPKGGEVYVTRGPSGRRRRHRASAPDETHANRSGKLRRSLGYKIGGTSTLEFGYGVDKPAPDYGEFVEFGTSRMAPRPTLQIAINQTNRNAELFVSGAFQRLIR